MSEPTGCAARCHHADEYCSNCDLLVGLAGLHVIGVERAGDDSLTITMESAPGVVGCPACGVVASSHGRRTVGLVDVPCMGRPVVLRWRKRTWECVEPTCSTGTFTEQDAQVAAPRAMLTTRACWWAVHQVRREHASIAGVARQLGASWRTVWESIKPILQTAAADEARFTGVTILGVDEHLWHHVSVAKRGPKELTGMVDLTRDKHGRIQARLLDLVPGRSGTVYKRWLKERGQPFRARVEVATLDPFHGYKNAIDDQLADATAVLDAFHVVKLSTQMVDDVRRRVQQDTLGHRGRKDDPLYKIRNILRAGAENLTARQLARLDAAITANDEHEQVWITWQCAQRVRAVYHADTPAEGRELAEKILAGFPACPIPEVARLGRTLKQWRDAFLGYFTTDGASNGGAEAVNGLIELHRRIARGFRNLDNYRLRMLLIAGGLDRVIPT